MLRRIFHDKAHRYLRKETLDVLKEKVRAGFEDQSVVPGKECLTRGQKVVNSTSDVGHSFCYSLPAGRVSLPFEYNGYACARFAASDV